ncbi:MAG: hypothetical protein A2Z83_00890 [Omnitrophica bacterium GWA2_52_8]|nr:MAG: hypothetical protein A2Z83_00890 [Omnitrophica bacterium GWA2_52_8]
MLAVTLYNPKIPYEEIDILTHGSLNYQKSALKNKILRVGLTRIFLVSIDELIRMKRKAGRAQDLSDVQALKKIKRMRRQKKI